MTLLFTSTLTVLLQRTTRLFLFSLLLLSLLLRPECGRIFLSFWPHQRQPKAWWSAEVDQVINERRKAFAAAHRSDANRQAYVSASRHASYVIVTTKSEACHVRRLPLPSHQNLILNLCTLLFALLLALLPHHPPLLSFPTVSFPGSKLRFSPIT